MVRAISNLIGFPDFFAKHCQALITEWLGLRVTREGVSVLASSIGFWHTSIKCSNN